MSTDPDPQLLRSHTFQSLQPGRRLIVLGAVHGNETCGTRGIMQVLAELESGTLRIVRGTVTFVPVTNALAYQRGQRAGERNLNRNLRPNDAPQDHEDRIANVLCPLLAKHEILLDLHSFHSPGEPFAMIGPPDNSGTLEPFARAAEEVALALRLGPRRLVEGWLDTYAVGVRQRLQRSQPNERAQMLSTDPSYGVGTTEYMRSVGGCAITLECGHHDDPQSVTVAYRAIRNALAHLGLVDAPAPPPCRDVEVLRLEQVTDRLHADDRFARPWASYDPVCRGEAIASRHDGTALNAPDDGFIVFPNQAAVPGNEWFYFARRSARRLNAT
ncbi:MAG: succinylglutamate desuccinylase/aspartoacylase family protein [Rhizobacter sp.]|nr:succinylglutamate desuccinylase/aspartoacylase family protein [Rhizobacter sp.]